MLGGIEVRIVKIEKVNDKIVDFSVGSVKVYKDFKIYGYIDSKFGILYISLIR